MLVNTRHFGEVELSEKKILHFSNGILGFEDLKDYTILYDKEDNKPTISWLQSTEEPSLALPVINPFIIMEDYNPQINDDILNTLGEITEDNIALLVSVTVQEDIRDMTANMKAPFIINTDTKKGCQVIAENKDYEIKHRIYEKMMSLKEVKGDS